MTRVVKVVQFPNFRVLSKREVFLPPSFPSVKIGIEKFDENDIEWKMTIPPLKISMSKNDHFSQMKEGGVEHEQKVPIVFFHLTLIRGQL